METFVIDYNTGEVICAFYGYDYLDSLRRLEFDFTKLRIVPIGKYFAKIYVEDQKTIKKFLLLENK